MGIVWALLTIFLFGSWAVPAKGLIVPPRVLAFWLTLGHFLLSTVVFIALGERLSWSDSLVPTLMGIVWAIGIIAGYASIQEIGITRAIGTWIPIIVVTSTVWGLTVFGETPNLFLLVPGLILVLVAAGCIIFSSKDESGIGRASYGYLMAVVLGLCHGSFFVPLQKGDLPIQATFLPLTTGMVLTTAVAAFWSRQRIWHSPQTNLRMLCAGLILGTGNYTALLTVKALGVAVGYPLTQLGIVINTLWGWLVFKEVTTNRGQRFILIGITAAIFGAVLANAARL